MTRSFTRTLALGAIVLGATLAACSKKEAPPAPAPAAEAPAKAEPLKAAFVYVGPVGDAGWSYSHDLGRRNAVARVLTRGADGSPTFGEVITLDTDGAAVYPVLAATSRGLVAVWTTGSGEQSAVRARQLNLE